MCIVALARLVVLQLLAFNAGLSHNGSWVLLSNVSVLSNFFARPRLHQATLTEAGWGGSSSCAVDYSKWSSSGDEQIR